MSATEGPNVVTNGLVLAVDAANIRSFRGEPTTNRLIESTRNHSGGMGAYWSGQISANNTEKGFPSFKVTTVNNDRLDGFITSNSGNLTNGVTYTWSADVWVPIGKTIQIRMRRITGGGDLASSRLNIAGTNSWIRVSQTFVADTNTSGAIEGNEQNNVTDVYSFWVKNLQLEQKPYATPFVNGTRGTTVGAGGGWADLSGGNNHGELVNGPTFNSSNKGSIVFDGVDDIIRIPNNTSLNTQTPTVEVWIKTNAVSQNGFWFEKGTVNTQYSLFQEGSVIQWRQMLTNGTLTNLSTTTANFINTSNWYQVVGTFVSGNRRLYINGTLVNSDTQSGTISTNTGGMSIGVYGGFSGARGYYYNGNIAQVRIYNRALSATEVFQNFNALRSRFGI